MSDNLDEIAANIHREYDLFIRGLKKAFDGRIEAGRLLAEGRQSCGEDEDAFQTFLHQLDIPIDEILLYEAASQQESRVWSYCERRANESLTKLALVDGGKVREVPDLDQWVREALNLGTFYDNASGMIPPQSN